MHILTLAKKTDMTYEFYIKHIMCALKWKLIDMMNKDKSLNNRLPVNWTHPPNKKFESYLV